MASHHIEVVRKGVDAVKDDAGVSARGTAMNWVLVFIIVSIATGDRAVNVTTIPMETEKLCTEGKDKLQKGYQETNAANWVLVSQCLQVHGN